MDTCENAYEKGWGDGYNDRLPDNEYEDGTDEYMSYVDGYEEGSRNS